MDFLNRLKGWVSSKFDSKDAVTGLIISDEMDEDPRNLIYEDLALGGPSDMPKEFILPDNGWTLSQGSVPSCVAHAWVHLLNFYGFQHSAKHLFWKIKTKVDYPSRNLAWGAYIKDGADCLRKEGICLFETLPNGDTKTSTAYLSVTESDQMRRQAEESKGGVYTYVATGADNLARFDMIRDYIWREKMPVVIGMKWFTSFNNRFLTRGIIPTKAPSGDASGHAILAIGFKMINGHEYLVCKNSWGSSWGDNGKIYVPKGFVRLTAGMGFLPEARVSLPVPLPESVKRNIHRERANAMDLKQWVYQTFPEGSYGRNVNMRHWLRLVRGITYYGWTIKDALSFIQAQATSNTEDPSYSYNFDVEKSVYFTAKTNS